MLVSEALFLLLSNKSDHFEIGVSHQRVALNGALLCDLVATDLARIEGGKSPKVVATPGAAKRASAHPALAHGVSRLEAKNGQTVYSALNSRKFADKNALAERLIEEGVLDRERASFLGLKWTRFPEKDETIEATMRGRYRDIFHGKAEPRAEEAIVILLLKNTGELRRVFLEEIQGVPFDDVRVRVRDIDRAVLEGATFDYAEEVNLVLDAVARAAAVEEESASS